MEPSERPAVLEDILASLRSLEPFPHVALEVLELSRKEDVLPREIVAVVQADAGITSKVLRLCNSAYYGFHREIASLVEAGNMLGVRTLVDLVMTGCASRYFRDYGGATAEGQDALWRRSVACALAAQHLARASDDVDEHRAYTAGLLLDVGDLVLSRFVRDAWEEIQAEILAGRDRLEAERRVLGIDHAETGARLVERWQLPEVLVDTLRWHHDPTRATVDPSLTWHVHLADSVVEELRLHEPDTLEPDSAPPETAAGRAHAPATPASPAALDAAGLSEADLANLGELLRADLDSAREFLAA